MVISGQRKLELTELCSVAREISLDVDPDGLVENRTEVISEKLTDGTMLFANPALLQGTLDISPLPLFNYMDVFSYLLSKDFTFGRVRDYRKSEGFTMMSDGYVKRVEVVTYAEQPGYFALGRSG